MLQWKAPIGPFNHEGKPSETHGVPLGGMGSGNITKGILERKFISITPIYPVSQLFHESHMAVWVGKSSVEDKMYGAVGVHFRRNVSKHYETVHPFKKKYHSNLESDTYLDFVLVPEWSKRNGAGSNLFECAKRLTISEGMTRIFMHVADYIGCVRTGREVPMNHHEHFHVLDKEKTFLVGIEIGRSKCFCPESYHFVLRLRRLSPFFVRRILINMAAGHVSMKYGFQNLGTQPNHVAVNSISDATTMIEFGYDDVMVVGGTEANINALFIAGFCK
ncbi:beta-ketoacyl synthase [Artemisia annua]|uniref:beta-ketoacyl-[acyl-carrier-protein] synthase I n=1 Tax=Artemisia annua TaxID=35608 RepID=A0A2U1PCB0_ARTAN|nr:beta-ketoacyl synthase [Artemisia annua]